MPLRNITHPDNREAGFSVSGVTTTSTIGGVWVVNGATALELFNPDWNPGVFSHYFRSGSSTYYYGGTRFAPLTVDLGPGIFRTVRVIRCRLGEGAGENNSNPTLNAFQFQGSMDGSAFDTLHPGFLVPHWRKAHYKDFFDVVIPNYEEAYRYFRVRALREGTGATVSATLNGWDFFDSWPDTEFEQGVYDINWYDIVNWYDYNGLPEFPVSNLTDGNQNSSWRSDTSNSYIEVEIAQPALANLILFNPTRGQGVYTSQIRWEIAGSNDRVSFFPLMPDSGRPFFRLTRHNSEYWPYLINLVGTNVTPFKFYRFRPLDNDIRVNEIKIGHMGRWCVGDIYLPPRDAWSGTAPAANLRLTYSVEGFTGAAAGYEDPDLGMPVIERSVEVFAWAGAGGDVQLPAWDVNASSGVGRQGHGDITRPFYEVSGVAGSPAWANITLPPREAEAHGGGHGRISRPHYSVQGTATTGNAAWGAMRRGEYSLEGLAGARGGASRPFPLVEGSAKQSVIAFFSETLPARTAYGFALVSNVARGDIQLPGWAIQGQATPSAIAEGGGLRTVPLVEGYALVGSTAAGGMSRPAPSVEGHARSDIRANGYMIRPGYVVVGGRTSSGRFDNLILRYRSPR